MGIKGEENGRKEKGVSVHDNIDINDGTIDA